MKIIVEYTFITSFVAHLLSIAVTEKIVKKASRFKWLAACFGSAVSLIYPLFHMGIILKILLLIFTLSIVTLICFKYARFSLFLRDFGLVFLASCLFGGINEAMRGLIGDFHLLIACIVIFASYLVITLIHKSVEKANKIAQFTYKLKIVDGKKVLEEEGYLDSGNVLCDSVTKKPIILITYDVFHKLYDDVSFIAAVTKSYDFKSFKNGHFEKINSVGGGNQILVFSVDELCIDEEKSFKDVMLGLSFSGFEKSFGKSILLNSALI
ncbi:MAG: sigma-E processing peptidase SpoIIGA [Clostridia bacterium]|nr:sigma-E processing peptidase SpoIIGA [Clostridia bacterium]